MKLTGNLDPNSKLQFGIGFAAKPGTGPKVCGGDKIATCFQCKFLEEHLEPMDAKGDVVRKRHLFFCGKIVAAVGPIKAIAKETPACSDFVYKKAK